MEHKLRELIELNDADLDVISGGQQSVGIPQLNNGGNFTARSSGAGGVLVQGSTNTNTQTNTNSGPVLNLGALQHLLGLA
jgi:hypothetical protein